MKWRYWVGAFALMTSLLWMPTVRAEQVDYQVSTKLPANQLNRQLSYFDLQVKPGATQTLKVVVANNAKQAKQFQIFTNTASTNNNGIIDYSHQVTDDPSLKYSLRSLMPAPQTIQVGAKQKRVVKLRLKTPAKRFRGVVLGGITVQEVLPKVKVKKGIAIQNQFAYVIGVQLHSKKGTVKPDLAFKQVQPKQIDGRNYLVATLRNPKPVIMHDLKIHATITPAGQDKALITTTKQQLTMAPNSRFEFPMSLASEPLKAGNYTFEMTATATKGRQHWHFKQQFSVADKQADQLNRTSVAHQASGPNWLPIILSSVIVLLLAIIGWLVYRRTRQTK